MGSDLLGSGHGLGHGSAREELVNVRIRTRSLVKPLVLRADQSAMTPEPHLPVKAGPVPDRLTIWPIDDGRYGLDATFLGASGYERAEHHRVELETRGVPHNFRQELGRAWTLRFGPLRAVEVARALAAFVY